MIEVSVARSAQEESPELVECFRHEGEECPRCDRSGFRPRKHCAGCGEPAGKVRHYANSRRAAPTLKTCISR